MTLVTILFNFFKILLNKIKKEINIKIIYIIYIIFI